MSTDKIKSLGILQKCITICLSMSALAQIWVIVNYAGMLFRVIYLNQEPSSPAMQSTGIGELVQAPFFLGAAISLLLWMYRAFENLVAAGIKKLSYTPGWAVGWWFVPLANCYKPYSAMCELSMASNPKGGIDNWYDCEKRTIFTVWWWSWIASRCSSYWGSQSLFQQFEDKHITHIALPPNWELTHLTGPVSLLLIGSLLQFLSTMLLIRIVRQVSNNQKLKLEMLAQQQQE